MINAPNAPETTLELEQQENANHALMAKFLKIMWLQVHAKFVTLSALINSALISLYTAPNAQFHDLLPLL